MHAFFDVRKVNLSSTRDSNDQLVIITNPSFEPGMLEQGHIENMNIGQGVPGPGLRNTGPNTHDFSEPILNKCYYY